MYPVSIFTNSSKATDENHILEIVSFKTPRDQKENKDYKRPVTRCVSLPVCKLTIQPDVIRDALQAAYYELRGQVVREIIVEHLEAGSQDASGKLKACVITEQQISMEAVAAFAARKAVGTKLSGEMLASWFDSDLASALELALIAVKKYEDEPTPEQQAILDAAIKQHKALIVKLAAPTATLPEGITKQLQRAIALADDSPVKTTLNEKLARFLKPVEELILEGLGE
jgi:hypothetical protein